MSKAKFAELVERALGELPEPFAEALETISLEIQTRPSASMRRRYGVKSRDLLMGVYEGVNFVDHSVEHSGVMPGKIYIFQEDNELMSETEEELVREVRITVLHEIGHLFGLDEDDLDRLGYG